MNIYATQVAAEWVDYNGHMNDAAYAASSPWPARR